MDRNKYLRHLKTKDSIEGLDTFTEKSLDGYQYLPQDLSAEEVLAKIDGKIDRHIVRQRPAIRRKLPLVLSIAATLALLIFVGVGQLNQSGPRTGNQLFLSYHTPLAVALPDKGTNRDLPVDEGFSSRIDQAFIHYEQGNYSTANALFAAAQGEVSSAPYIQFYYGLSLLAAGESDRSIEQLTPLLHTFTDGAYQENVQWYLALAYVEQADFARAEPLLNALQLSRFYQHKAANLLQELQNQ